MDYQSFNYVIYIGATIEKLWEALTKADSSKKYWFGRAINSNWEEEQAVQFFDEEGVLTDFGKIAKYEKYNLLSYLKSILETRQTLTAI